MSRRSTAAGRAGPTRPTGGWQNSSFQGYADHMASAEFREGLDRLLAQERPAPVWAEA